MDARSLADPVELPVHVVEHPLVFLSMRREEQGANTTGLFTLGDVMAQDAFELWPEW